MVSPATPASAFDRGSRQLFQPTQRSCWLHVIIALSIICFVANQKSLKDSNLLAKKQEMKVVLPANEQQMAAIKAFNHPPTSDCLHHINNIRGLALYSQNDEDGALLQTLQCMGGHGSKEYFEFGSESGSEVNTRILRELYGWHGHLLDGSNENSAISLHREYFTPSNIVSLMKKYDVSKELDVLSVDCDIDDFYITREILLGGYRPRVIINEFNINFGWNWEVAVLPKPVGKESSLEFAWNGDCYYGASARAFISLAKIFGYAPVFANTVNLIFVRIDKAEELGLSFPSPDIFPGPLTRALHRECPMKTWKKVDAKAIENAANPSISHVEFANGMDEIILDCKTYSSQKQIVSASIPLLHSTGWRVFTEVKNE
jgi:hypothetical protein